MGYLNRKKEISERSNLCWKDVLFISIVFVTMLCLGSLAMAQDALKPVSEEEFKKGKDIYIKYCAVCHGEEGDGEGPLARALYPKPRDFIRGQFKIRTNPSGSVPTDADLIHVIYTGIHGTSMIPWDILEEEQIKAMLPVIKSFSIAWQYRKPEPSVILGREMRPTQKTIARGKKLYEEKECWKCHGKTGRGDGPSSYDLEDEWGIPILPYDFTRESKYKGGSTDRDIYLRFTTGMNGTPMPSFANELSDEDRWCMVHYVKSLAKQEISKEKE